MSLAIVVATIKTWASDFPSTVDKQPLQWERGGWSLGVVVAISRVNLHLHCGTGTVTLLCTSYRRVNGVAVGGQNPISLRSDVPQGFTPPSRGVWRLAGDPYGLEVFSGTFVIARSSPNPIKYHRIPTDCSRADWHSPWRWGILTTIPTYEPLLSTDNAYVGIWPNSPFTLLPSILTLHHSISALDSPLCQLHALLHSHRPLHPLPLSHRMFTNSCNGFVL